MVPAWALFGLISSRVALGARFKPNSWGNGAGTPVTITAQKKRMDQEPGSTPEISEWFPNTTTTATTTLEPEKVKISFSIAGITPEDLDANPAFKDSLAASLQTTVATNAGVPHDWVDIAFVGASSFTVTTYLKMNGGVVVDATITVPGDTDVVATTPASINHNLQAGGNLASLITQTVKDTVQNAPPEMVPVGIHLAAISVRDLAIVVVNTHTPPVDVSSYGDPHCKDLHGNRFDIQYPGNHSFLVLPRGADQVRANLHVEARVTRRGGLCTGKLFVTSLKLAGRWMRTLG
eukprot:CAMPEP_0168407630 /NCGR_PEP_ID=MMETSP0228-20121227/26260_1 /TAXON_ID=133427 /ORGANISM="Protoceratium reticulatum, Strain CCCM 535 (=CCMP 1889)" /LENGTH=291 /DNA_ID=CAMNT_0008421303 /DNA_START=66 /DNA_END=937 /DNA_ORIENTATION=+